MLYVGHALECTVTKQRVELLEEIKDAWTILRDAGSTGPGKHTANAKDEWEYLMGALVEYFDAGDQEVEECTCTWRNRFKESIRLALETMEKEDQVTNPETLRGQEEVAQENVMETFGMEQYKRYRIVYQRYGGRVWDEVVAQYLGPDVPRGELTLNLRPLAGTSALRPDMIKHVEETDKAIRLPHRSDMQNARDYL